MHTLDVRLAGTSLTARAGKAISHKTSDEPAFEFQQEHACWSNQLGLNMTRVPDLVAPLPAPCFWTSHRHVRTLWRRRQPGASGVAVLIGAVIVGPRGGRRACPVLSAAFHVPPARERSAWIVCRLPIAHPSYYGYYSPYYSPYGYASPYPGYPYPAYRYPGYRYPAYAYPAYPYSAYPYPPAGYPGYPASTYLPPSSAPGSVGVQPDQSQANTGGLSFEITPGTAEVFLDGSYVGTVGQFTPTTQPLGVTPGCHRIEIRAQGYRTLTSTWISWQGRSFPMGVMER